MQETLERIGPIASEQRFVSSLDLPEAIGLFQAAFGYEPDPADCFQVNGTPPGRLVRVHCLLIQGSHHSLLIYSNGNMMASRQDGEQTHAGFNAVNVLAYLDSLGVKFSTT
ncbi:hypothetical protein [Fibrella aestuarina]|uniref:hypothetical protein n=1 Tax=Fibrella aestuarina TaxID=651143 RepID=UPI00059BD5F7|nr:hypothetical protein [Fibrella aestuarina]